MRNSFFYIFNFLNCKHKSLLTKIKFLLYSFFLTYTFLFISVLLIIIPIDSLVTKVLNYESIVILLKNTNVGILKNQFYKVALIVPIVEETLFRLILKFNKLNISIFIGFLFYFVIGGKVMDFEPENYKSYVSICLTFIIILFSNRFLPNRTASFLDSKKRILVFVSIFCFGLVHIANIKTLYWQLTLVYPFYVLPQMIMGYFITNLRLKYGFIWGFFLHALINSMPYIITKLLS